ncbi:MAG: hypothetical protein GOVbin4933_29 [Prokaryotic dsDNA virus sp.]|nr:MAG: hypothetical protein GOVbin4933_29 [Prokaryotic dsDNA virus sp.]|tara:strand:+ start:585 stop:755 length:171 start_codon:yes stop_codon:yes gene_type:complete
MNPSRSEVVGMVRDKMERHPGIDWTCAVQAVAMEIAWNEQELLEDLAEYKGENHDQ